MTIIVLGSPISVVTAHLHFSLTPEIIRARRPKLRPQCACVGQVQVGGVAGGSDPVTQSRSDTSKDNITHNEDQYHQETVAKN